MGVHRHGQRQLPDIIDARSAAGFLFGGCQRLLTRFCHRRPACDKANAATDKQNSGPAPREQSTGATHRDIWVLWKQVADAFKEKNYAFAVSLCNTALANTAEPLQRAHFLSYRGHAHFYLNQLDAAMADYNEALKVQPGYASALSGRGALFQIKHKPELALQDYNNATQSDPD